MGENYPAGQKCLGYEQLDVSTSEVGFAELPANAKRAEITVEEDVIRYTVDGITAPTTDVGFLVLENVAFVLYGSLTLKNFLAIRDAAADAKLSIHYYG